MAVPAAETPSGAPGPLPWRPILAGWPDGWRERWGLRTAALEDAGLDWRSAERAAFVEVLAEKRAGPERRSEPSPPKPAERQTSLI